MEVTENEALYIIIAYGGVLRVREVRGTRAFRIFREAGNQGFITRVRVAYSGRSYIQWKDVWWNKKRETIEYVKRMREYLTSNTMYAGNHVYVITPLGLKEIGHEVTIF